MRISTLLFATVAFAAFAVPAAAATKMKFVLQGDLNAEWVVPDLSRTATSSILGLTSTAFDANIGGQSDTFLLFSRQEDQGAGIQINKGADFFTSTMLFLGIGEGIPIFDRDLGAYVSGTYNFTRSVEDFPGNGTLTISTINSVIPEPASWAMMIAGFGLVGSALRRRQGVAAA